MDVSTAASDIGEALKHPLVLIVAQWNISSVIIPRITNTWQNHKKELELKIDLIKQMGSISASAMANASLLCDTEKETRKIYGEWFRDMNTLRSVIYAYFPNSKVAYDWHTYVSMLSNYYTLAANLGHDRKLK